MSFQEMIESLYNLTGDELRALAWEALLISDGPDAVHKSTSDSQINVEVVDTIQADFTESHGFTITGHEGWETPINTMPDTPLVTE
jgi:hypothetical protein